MPTRPRLNFTVDSAVLPTSNAATAPVQYDMENTAPGWSATGLWKLSTFDKPNRGLDHGLALFRGNQLR